MQTPRERFLALSLLMAIFVVGGGFIAYQFLYLPIREKGETIRTLEKELDDRQDRLLAIEGDLPRLDAQIRRSLPGDVDLSRREYEIKLNQLLRDSQFAASSITIDPRPADSVSSPMMVPKKPIYTKLTFVVQVRGELIQLVDFMASFYKQDLLHQIKKLSIQKLATSERGQKASELDINFTIEALVLDVAEKRPTILPSNAPAGSMVIRVVAEPGRDYGAIAGRDVYNGPTPAAPPPARVRTEEKAELDFAPFFWLTSVTTENDSVPAELPSIMALGGSMLYEVPAIPYARAELFDMYNNFNFVVEQAIDGTSEVNGYYYLNDRKRSLMKGKLLAIGEEDAKNRVFFRIVRIQPSDVIMQKVDGTGERPRAIAMLGGNLANLGRMDPLYSWHIGDLLKDIKRLSTSESLYWGAVVRGLGPLVDDKKRLPGGGR